MNIPPIAFEAAKRAKVAADSLAEKLCTLSVGMIGVSMAFIPADIRASAGGAIWLLHFSWVCFAFSVLCTLGYFYAPIDMAESQIEVIKKNPEVKQLTTVAWRGFVWFFRGALVAFLIGTIALVGFGLCATAQKSDKKKAQQAATANDHRVTFGSQFKHCPRGVHG